MNELRRKVLEIIRGVPDEQLMLTLVIDAVASGLGRLRRSPRNGTGNTSLTHVESDGWDTGGIPLHNGRENGHLSSDLSSGSLDLISDSGLSKPLISKSESDEPEPAGFLEFWALYPRKVGKADARRAWKRKRPPITKVRAALEWQRRSLQWQQGFIPNPSTYVNQGRWDDEPVEGPAAGGYSQKEIRGMTAGDLFVAAGRKP